MLLFQAIMMINFCVTQMSRKIQGNGKIIFGQPCAKLAGMTAEALRHYDRIGLVKPCRVDEWTGYRYYSQQEIVRLNTVKALRCMDLTLEEIKEILSYDDFGRIVEALRRAEAGADEKIAELNSARERIRRARMYYEGKAGGEAQAAGHCLRNFPQRVILLSDTLETPSLDNLWNYHRHFFAQLPQDIRDDFAFEDAAGVYLEDGSQRLFAVCTRYRAADGLKVLPQGRWLCADCTGDDRDSVTEQLAAAALADYGVAPGFAVQMIVVSGILQWNYQAQVFISG